MISDLSEEQQYYIDVLTARSDNHNLVIDYNTQNILNANENRVIYLSYVEGYSPPKGPTTSSAGGMG